MIQIKNLNGDVIKEVDADTLQGANLKGANLKGANLKGANLKGANLYETNLQGAYLQWAYLQGAYLYETNLQGAYLQGANLEGANLKGANLEGAYLQWAYLEGANLKGANLEGANLQGANLEGANLPHFTLTPEEGEFIAWKKASGCILKLRIPATARRTSSLVGRKCRAEFVDVLEIQNEDGKAIDLPEGVLGDYDGQTLYQVGERIMPDSYDDDIRVECSHGIHFFLTRKEAVDY